MHNEKLAGRDQVNIISVRVSGLENNVTQEVNCAQNEGQLHESVKVLGSPKVVLVPDLGIFDMESPIVQKVICFLAVATSINDVL